MMQLVLPFMLWVGMIRTTHACVILWPCSRRKPYGAKPCFAALAAA